jgi:hypothetical protein
MWQRPCKSDPSCLLPVQCLLRPPRIAPSPPPPPTAPPPRPPLWPGRSLRTGEAPLPTQMIKTLKIERDHQDRQSQYHLPRPFPVTRQNGSLRYHLRVTQVGPEATRRRGQGPAHRGRSAAPPASSSHVRLCSSRKGTSAVVTTVPRASAAHSTWTWTSGLRLTRVRLLQGDEDL